MNDTFKVYVIVGLILSLLSTGSGQGEIYYSRVEMIVLAVPP